MAKGKYDSWIFKAAKNFNLKNDMQINKISTWKATKLFNYMEKGDRVYLWQSGDENGLHGWGMIESDGFYLDDKGKKIIDVKYLGVLDPFIHKNELKQNVVLRTLTVIKSTSGTNFGVLSDQQIELEYYLPFDNIKTEIDYEPILKRLALIIERVKGGRIPLGSFLKFIKLNQEHELIDLIQNTGIEGLVLDNSIVKIDSNLLKKEIANLVND